MVNRGPRSSEQMRAAVVSLEAELGRLPSPAKRAERTALGEGTVLSALGGLHFTAHVKVEDGLFGQRLGHAVYADAAGQRVGERLLALPATDAPSQWWTATAVRLQVEPQYERQGVAAGTRGGFAGSLTTTGTSSRTTDENLAAVLRGLERCTLLPPEEQAAAMSVVNRRLSGLCKFSGVQGRLVMNGRAASRNSIGVPRGLVLLLASTSPRALRAANDAAGASLTSVLGDWHGVRALSSRSRWRHRLSRARLLAALRNS